MPIADRWAKIIADWVPCDWYRNRCGCMRKRPDDFTIFNLIGKLWAKGETSGGREKGVKHNTN